MHGTSVFVYIQNGPARQGRNAVTSILCVHHHFRELRMEAVGKQKAHYTCSLTGSDQLKLPFREQFLDIFIAYL